MVSTSSRGSPGFAKLQNKYFSDRSRGILQRLAKAGGRPTELQHLRIAHFLKPRAQFFFIECSLSYAGFHGLYFVGGSLALSSVARLSRSRRALSSAFSVTTIEFL
jgi:hypothetical protein